MPRCTKSNNWTTTFIQVGVAHSSTPCRFMLHYVQNQNKLWWWSRPLKPTVMITTEACKAPAKRSQHVNATYRNIVGHNMLRAVGHHVATCCDMLGVVGSNLTIFKLELSVLLLCSLDWAYYHPVMWTSLILVKEDHYLDYSHDSHLSNHITKEFEFT